MNLRDPAIFSYFTSMPEVLEVLEVSELLEVFCQDNYFIRSENILAYLKLRESVLEASVSSNKARQRIFDALDKQIKKNTAQNEQLYELIKTVACYSTDDSSENSIDWSEEFVEL